MYEFQSSQIRIDKLNTVPADISHRLILAECRGCILKPGFSMNEKVLFLANSSAIQKKINCSLLPIRYLANDV